MSKQQTDTQRFTVAFKPAPADSEASGWQWAVIDSQKRREPLYAASREAAARAAAELNALAHDDDERDEIAHPYDVSEPRERVHLLPGDEVRVYEQRHEYPTADEADDPPFPIATIVSVNRHPNNPTWVRTITVRYHDDTREEQVRPSAIASWLFPEGGAA